MCVCVCHTCSLTMIMYVVQCGDKKGKTAWKWLILLNANASNSFDKTLEIKQTSYKDLNCYVLVCEDCIYKRHILQLLTAVRKTETCNIITSTYTHPCMRKMRRPWVNHTLYALTLFTWDWTTTVKLQKWFGILNRHLLFAMQSAMQGINIAMSYWLM